MAAGSPAIDRWSELDPEPDEPTALQAVPDEGAEREGISEQVFALIYSQMRAIAAASHQELDDLVQIAAEQAFRALPQFEGRSRLSTWTYRICYHVLIDHERWSKRFFRRFAVGHQLPEQDDPAPLAEESLERRERITRLRAALSRVAPKRRAVVVLHDLEGLSIDEVAEIVGAKKNTVKSRLRDGHRQLARLLSEDPYFGDAACARKENP